MNHKLRKQHNIYLVRHGESESNKDIAVLNNTADPAIKLTPLGYDQAKQAGEFLAKALKDNSSVKPKVLLWVSPYKRTRQTAKQITYYLVKNNLHISEPTESPLLVEQSFGVCHGRHDKHMWDGFKLEEHQALLNQQANPAGRFWTRIPHGESQFDVSQRVHQFFDEIYHYDNPSTEIINHIIVGHGVVNRAFRFMWMNYPYEFWAKTPNPHNCEVWLLEQGIDRGSIFIPN